MGNQNSIISTNSETQEVQQNNGNIYSTEFRESQDPELRSMRLSLRNDQESFLLNNLMICLQFFENYEREIKEIRSRPMSPREEELNAILSQSQKHILIPGVLEDQVSRHVNILSTGLTDCDTTIEPLQPVRMYVVLDNVYVNKSVKIPNKNTLVDPISYNMRSDLGSNDGYVKLRLLRVTKEQLSENSESDLPFIAEDDDELHSETKDIPDPRVIRRARNPSGVRKHDVTMIRKLRNTQSMTNLYNVDKNGKTAFLRMDRSLSQTNLTLSENQDDEGYQDSTYGGLSERRYSGGSKQFKQLKGQRPSTQQHRRTLETPRSTISSGYGTVSSGRNSMDWSDSDYSYGISTCSIASSSSMGDILLPDLSSEIPALCFKTFICTPNGKVYSEKPKINSKNRKEKRMKKAELHQSVERSYLKSRKFRQYFKNLFVDQLAKPLGFEIEGDNDVTRKGAVIQCYLMKTLEGNPAIVIPHEIVPCISLDWQDSCSDWLERSSSAIFNKVTWFTKEMVDKVKTLDCHIIPELYLSTKTTNPYHEVEWQLNFPAAERYLETCLSHSQTRVYMTALLLQKSFIISTDSAFALTTSHIRSQLFWFIEQNSSKFMWSETQTGERLKELLNNLIRAVAASWLEDYFITKKNLFAQIPLQNIHLIQNQIKHIIDNPVLYLITAMKNIRYKPNFFPVMDYNRLYKLLTVNEADLLALISPDRSSSDSSVSEMEMGNENNPAFESDKIIDNHKNGVKISKNSSKELVHRIVDQCVKLHGLRLTSVLSMFIKHFITMANSCYHYGAMEQKKIYLNQARRLSIILQEQTYGKEDAEKYLDMINTLKRELSSCKTQDQNELKTSARKDQSSISIPFNRYFVNETEQQREVELPQSYTITINEFDIHREFTARSQQTVDLEMQEQTKL